MELLRKLAVLIDLRDCLFFGGFFCIVYGLSQIYAPAAWIFAGITSVAIGLRK